MFMWYIELKLRETWLVHFRFLRPGAGSTQASAIACLQVGSPDDSSHVINVVYCPPNTQISLPMCEAIAQYGAYDSGALKERFGVSVWTGSGGIDTCPEETLDSFADEIRVQFEQQPDA